MDHQLSNYQYDSKDRLIDIKTIDTTDIISATTFSTTAVEAKFTYDNDNRMTQVLGYINNNLSSTTNYTYAPGSVSVHEVTGSIVSDYTMTLDNNNRIISFTNTDDYQSYKYDSMGNIISFSDLYNPLSPTTPQIIVTSSYDNQKGWFSNIVGNTGIGNENESKNNLMGYVVTYPLQPSSSYTVSNRYTYNSDGYPTSCISTVVTTKNTTNYKATYTYLTK